MASTDRDLALAACDDTFKECIKKITGVLEDCLANAKDEKARQDCKSRYKRGMKLCKDAHDINRETVVEVFPKQK